MGVIISCIESILQTIGGVLIAIANAIGAIFFAIIDGILALFDLIVGCLTCRRGGGTGWRARRTRRRGGGMRGTTMV